MGMDQTQAAIMAVIELETKLHFDRDHDRARTLTQTDCDSARASVLAAGHLLPSIVQSTLLSRIEGAECWLAGRKAQAKG
jgi:hypothetical protein